MPADTRPARRRRYSDADRAVALAAVEACDGDAAKAALHVGMPARTLQAWVSGERREGDGAELCAEKKGDLADALEDVAWTRARLDRVLVLELAAAVPSMTVAELNETRRVNATALGIAADKVAALRGGPEPRPNGHGPHSGGGPVSRLFSPRRTD